MSAVLRGNTEKSPVTDSGAKPQHDGVTCGMPRAKGAVKGLVVWTWGLIALFWADQALVFRSLILAVKWMTGDLELACKEGRETKRELCVIQKHGYTMHKSLHVLCMPAAPPFPSFLAGVWA